MAPEVDPAQPPENISRKVISRQSEPHDAKSDNPNPVLVIAETT